MKSHGILAALIALIAGFAIDADACSLITYKGDSTLVMVGRSLDWKTPIPTNLYVYPRGMQKVGTPAPDAVKWTSKYGAVYAVSYDGGITEGMNEKGLIVNGLFCKGTVYSNINTRNGAPMSLAVFVAWILDNNATTAEAVQMLKTNKFSISGATFDGGTVSALHWGITDAKGNMAILEFDNGDIRIYEGEDIKALTNDPPYPQMQAINKYWQGIGGTHFLPGTVKSPDRFARISFFEENVHKTDDPTTALAIVRSIIMNASVPYQYAVEGEPNLSSTQWRSFGNLRDRLYYFEPVTHLGVVYVDLKECDLRPGASVRKLTVDKAADKVGCINSSLEKVAPFNPMY